MYSQEQKSLVLLSNLKTKQHERLEQRLKALNLELENLLNNIKKIEDNILDNSIKKRLFIKNGYANMKQNTMKSNDFKVFEFLIKKFDIDSDELKEEVSSLKEDLEELNEQIKEVKQQMKVILTKREKYQYLHGFIGSDISKLHFS